MAKKKDMAAVARRFIVKGWVQGIGYRFFAIRAANQLGIVGTVRNLPDGSVEVVAEGQPDAMEEFRLMLQQGPSSGHVAAVEELKLPPTGKHRSFDVSY